MWQRIQTLYLVISTVLIAVMLFSAEAACFDADGNVLDTLRFSQNIGHLILIIVLLLLNLLSLGSFRFRVFQLRTVVLATIVALPLQIWLVLDYINFSKEYIFKIPSIFPLVFIILNILAARGILADQMLVESSSSLRKSRRERRSKK